MSDEGASAAVQTVAIAEGLDVFVARWAAQRLARSMGFDAAACQEIAIVVSELATNILKYGIRGRILVQSVVDAERGAGLELVAEDEGPPLTDLATALKDGFGDHGPIDPARQVGRGGIGAGLGAIRRFTDVFEYRPRALPPAALPPSALQLPPPAHPPHPAEGRGRSETKAFRAVRYLARRRRRYTR